MLFVPLAPPVPPPSPSELQAKARGTPAETKSVASDRLEKRMGEDFTAKVFQSRHCAAQNKQRHGTILTWDARAVVTAPRRAQAAANKLLHDTRATVWKR